MSVHYVCRLNDDVSGRRYDAIKDRVFEIQVRTLCMHAWAAISHYLDYKADWDIPSPLKKDLNALSALFYLADTQYESIFNSREEVRVLSESNEQEKQHTLINFDNLFEYLKNKYPDRQLSRSSVSPLVGELIEAGIDSIESLDADLDARKSQFEAEESDRTDGPYAAVGVVRISLRKTHPEYKKVYDQKSRNAVTAAKLRRKSS